MLTHSGNAERRKSLKVRLRADLAIAPITFEGRTHYLVKDPVSLRYFRFQEREHFLMRCMDGHKTLADAQKECEAQFRPHRLSLEEVEGFAHLLLTSGLAHTDASETGDQLFEQREKERRLRRFQKWTDLLALPIPVFDPDRLLGWLAERIGWALSPRLLVAGAGLILAALLFVTTHLATFQSKLPGFHAFFNAETLFYLWVTLAAVKILHEFGHGLSCKVFGGEVHEMGVLLLCFAPCLYCNVSDAWTIPQKWRRMAIGLAGIYVELLIASAATFVWWNATGHPFLQNLCLCLMIVCGTGTVLFNANPLLRFDGYFVLADWLEIPNLRERAGHQLNRLIGTVCLGIEGPPQPYATRGRRAFLAGFAVASTVYRWVLTLTVLWLLYKFLKAYRLESLGALLAVVILTVLVARSFFPLVKRLCKRGRMSVMKPRRLAASAGIVTAGVLAFFLMPLPVGRVRQTALVQVRPEAVEKVFLPCSALLERIYVRDGKRVQANQVLAELRCPEVEALREEARSEKEVREAQLHALQEQTLQPAENRDSGQFEVIRATLMGEVELFARQTEVYDKLLKRLVVRAARAGVVVNPPRIDDIGKVFPKDEPFCLIVDPRRLQAIVPVSPPDRQLLHEARAAESPSVVTVRIRGRKGQPLSGQLLPLPESEAVEIPIALTTRAGGPVAVLPSEKPDARLPQTQQYLLTVEFEDTGDNLLPGALAQVQIPGPWRSASWWLWRTLGSTVGWELR